MMREEYAAKFKAAVVAVDYTCWTARGSWPGIVGWGPRRRESPYRSDSRCTSQSRAWLGVARTGSSTSNGSGDYAIAFSTAPQVRIRTEEKALSRRIEVLTNDAMSPLFLAVIEATEEAVYNSLFRATTTTGRGHTVEALPIEKTVEILRKYGAIK